MTLDRQSIEKRDFPIARRGYDPAGVDAHLARIADDIDQLRREGDRAATGGVAGSAATHVQSIVEAAEATSERLLREAQAEAAELRERAAGDAQRSRQEALEESREHVAKVGEQTTRMLQRVEAMDGELGGMLESLRTGVNRLVADLALLEGNIADLHEQHGGVAPVTGFSTSFVKDPEPGPATDAEVVATETTPAVDASGLASPAESSVIEASLDDEDEFALVEVDVTTEQAGGSEDSQESARIIALDLALGGADRDEVKTELESLYGEIDDLDNLLDRVFASIDA